MCPACNYELSGSRDYCENCGAPVYLAIAVQATEFLGLLAWVALVPLQWALDGKTKTQAFWIGVVIRHDCLYRYDGLGQSIGQADTFHDIFLTGPAKMVFQGDLEL